MKKIAATRILAIIFIVLISNDSLAQHKPDLKETHDWIVLKIKNYGQKATESRYHVITDGMDFINDIRVLRMNGELVWIIDVVDRYNKIKFYRVYPMRIEHLLKFEKLSENKFILQGSNLVNKYRVLVDDSNVLDEKSNELIVEFDISQEVNMQVRLEKAIQSFIELKKKNPDDNEAY